MAVNKISLTQGNILWDDCITNKCLKKMTLKTAVIWHVQVSWLQNYWIILFTSRTNILQTLHKEQFINSDNYWTAQSLLPQVCSFKYIYFYFILYAVMKQFCPKCSRSTSLSLLLLSVTLSQGSRSVDLMTRPLCDVGWKRHEHSNSYIRTHTHTHTSVTMVTTQWTSYLDISSHAVSDTLCHRLPSVWMIISSIIIIININQYQQAAWVSHLLWQDKLV